MDQGIPGGAILWARKVAKSKLRKRPVHYRLIWEDMVLHATFAPEGRVYCGQQLNRGELIVTYKILMGWGSYTAQHGDWIPLSYNGARNVISWMKKEGMIKVRPFFYCAPEMRGLSTRATGGLGRGVEQGGGLVVTILNYDKYQLISGGKSVKVEQGGVAGGCGTLTNKGITNNVVKNTSYSQWGDEKGPLHTPKIEPLPCPHEKIKEVWNQVKLPYWTECKVMTDTRKGMLRARWRSDTKMQSVEAWKDLFVYCKQSQFLAGEARPRKKGDSPFKLSLDWLIRPNNFAKIVEGRYHYRKSSASDDDAIAKWLEYRAEKGD